MKMKRYCRGIAAGLLSCGLIATSAVAAEEAPYAELAVSTYSQYIWRGFAFSQDSIVVQPSLTVGYQGFSVNLWGNLDTDPVGGDKASWNETDLTLAYDWTTGPVDFSAGYIYYGLEGADDTQELYLSAAYDVLLNPTLTIYRDFADAPGWYVTLGVSHSIPLRDEIALELGAQAGYLWVSSASTMAEVGSDKAYRALHDGLISAAVPIPVGQYLTVTPELAYSFALSSKARDLLKEANSDAIGKDKDNFIYGGITLSMAF